MTDTKKMQDDIQNKALARLTPLFNRYGLDPESLQAAMKWKSIVLVLGNFSSGKSTLINELFNTNVQRTGQSPTDDSFTIITAPAEGAAPKDIPGSALLNDDRLPFTSLKKYGEQLTAHLTMKEVDSPQLNDMAIIDTPGMLDAITEKDRGYNYSGVIGDLAKLADLVVLMFDPHKAGTIREVYETIRTTLPSSLSEDRIIFVMSRIDECDNPSDLIRSYGTLCWNLSQMTGRKDIPRIFLTFSPAHAANQETMSAWNNERDELKEIILSASSLRVSHVLQHIDKQAHELKMVTEALASFSAEGQKLLKRTTLNSLGVGLFFFLFLDIIVREFTGLPDVTIISSLLSGEVGPANLVIPILGFVGVTALMFYYFSRIQFPRLRRKSTEMPESLVILNNDYREQLWQRMKGHIKILLGKVGLMDVLPGHQSNLGKIDRFIEKELQDYYKQAS